MRTYNLQLHINNGVERVYLVRRLDPSTLPNPFVRGYSLVEQTQNPKPRYRVMLAADGVINCTCPQWQKTEACKHADCLRVAGLLDVDFAAMIHSRTELLDNATAEVDALKKDLATLTDEGNQLEAELLSIHAELATIKQALTVPKRRGRAKKVA
jgi:hypothetical protein